ncbi:MAG: flagellar biosynthetic protein FliO [Vulcanibacillus sp.]
MKKILLMLMLFSVMINNRVYASLEELQTEGISNDDIIKMFIYLIVILLLIYSLFWFINKKNRFIKSSLFNNFGGHPLGQNKSIQVIEIGNKIYILGVSGEINLIKVLEEEEDIKAIKKLVYSNDGRSKMFTLFKNKKKSSKQFENELAEKFDQLKEKRLYSINNIFDERDEITEKRD